MPEVVSLWGVLGLLLVSVLSGLLGDRPSPDPRAPPGDLTRTDLGAPEPRRRPPPKDQALPLGALYTAAVVAFVLYKCLQQGKHEAAILPEEEADKEPLQSEQQLALLTQQLAQTEQHLNNLMAQLDPLFECSSFGTRSCRPFTSCSERAGRSSAPRFRRQQKTAYPFLRTSIEGRLVTAGPGRSPSARAQRHGT
ncbi:coiled-coil domain-containing protein 107 isoform X3 [Tenrec ecaudatus]|uniref:coiled-coil domain-containing protein 107 isoform X3 n=1 Tax=Tenrec ecaudatus TaxID=94439 RepID=UPI003F599E3B